MENLWLLYRRTQLTELRPVTKQEIEDGYMKLKSAGISISLEDAKNGSPKEGDMIARNPKNRHNDLWLVAKEYFEHNFEGI